MTVTLCLIFFLSGASALIFELLWFRLAGLTFGSSVWATSVVLSSFMGGLALGCGLAAFWGHRIRSPIRLYAYLECTIAISGFGLVLAFPKLTGFFVPVFRHFLEQPLFLNAVRGFIAFFLMFVPATAMGTTLPVLVKALYTAKPNFGRVLGLLYGWNTLGAVGGVITSELFFVKWFGIRETGLVAASFNLIAAIMALWLSRKHVRPKVVSGEPERPHFSLDFSFIIGRLLLASFLSGLTILALEVIWFRFILLFFFDHSWNFAVMLAAVLLGISLGGMVTSKWFQLREGANNSLVPILFLNGILVVMLYRNFGFVLDFLREFGNDLRISLVSLFLMFPVSFISGIVFTMLGKTLHEKIEAETQAAGLLTLANTTGGMLGSFLGLFLIPFVGIENSFFVLALTYGVIALFVCERRQFGLSGRRIPLHHMAAGGFLISLIIYPFGFMARDYLEISIPDFFRAYRGERRVAIREGLTQTIQYLQKDLLGEPYYYRLMTNNYSMSGTTLKAKRYMKMFVYWPMAVHPKPERALLIGFGVGTTAKGLTDTESLKDIAIVDISRDIIEMSNVVFRNPEENPINDPRVKIIIEDARFFLLTTERKFDLITAEPSPPASSGIVNLYTQEYFQLIHDRLSEGGIVTYWLPVYQLKVSEAKSILKAFCNVFSHCSLWSGAGLEWMMVGMKNPQKAERHGFVRQWYDPVVGSEMRALGFVIPEQFGSLFIADGPRLRNWISDSLPLRDNYPHRISYELSVEQEKRSQYIPAYWDFMTPDVCRTNFMESEGMKMIWPRYFREMSEEHFATRRMITELLEDRPVPLVPYLHRCYQNPILAHYIPWLFGSDQYAQSIVKKTLGKELNDRSDRVNRLMHLTAIAAQQRRYLQAERFCHLAMKIIGPQNAHKDFFFVRMYFLFITGNKERALEVGREYINVEGADSATRKEEVAQYWYWLVNTLQ
ncbi:MAG: spermidine synthase [Proteobacteria bacterium]|nr:spermidine synthase [Pseudomonadota bacterium]